MQNNYQLEEIEEQAYNYGVIRHKYYKVLNWDNNLDKLQEYVKAHREINCDILPFDYFKGWSPEEVDEFLNIFTEETFKFDGKKVSTSEIKKYIKSGSIVEANCRLGYNYFIKGVVTKGKQMGRTIGFPTMNIQNDNVLYPKAGSYFTTTEVNNKNYPSMTFVSDSIVETHLIGYKDYAYGFPIRVDFLQKIIFNV